MGSNDHPRAELTVDTEMGLRRRVALAWHILWHRRVTFSVHGSPRAR